MLSLYNFAPLSGFLSNLIGFLIDGFLVRILVRLVTNMEHGLVTSAWWLEGKIMNFNLGFGAQCVLHSLEIIAIGLPFFPMYFTKLHEAGAGAQEHKRVSFGFFILVLG